MLQETDEIVIGEKDVNFIVRQSLLSFPKEACGLLGAERLSDTCIRLTAFPVSNRAHRNGRFFIPNTEIKRIAALCTLSGYQLCGCYHSHAKGFDKPSIKDMESASGSSLKIWAIYAVRYKRLGMYYMSDSPIRCNYRIV